jgi:hypothetical protein
MRFLTTVARDPREPLIVFVRVFRSSTFRTLTRVCRGFCLGYQLECLFTCPRASVCILLDNLEAGSRPIIYLSLRFHALGLSRR